MIDFYRFIDTSLYAAVMTEFTEQILIAEIGESAGYTLIRARTILPQAKTTGSLAMHAEKNIGPISWRARCLDGPDTARHRYQ